MEQVYKIADENRKTGLGNPNEAELILDLAHKHRHLWHDQPSDFWITRLRQEAEEFLNPTHHHTPIIEAIQLAAMLLNFAHHQARQSPDRCDLNPELSFITAMAKQPDVRKEDQWEHMSGQLTERLEETSTLPINKAVDLAAQLANLVEATRKDFSDFAYLAWGLGPYIPTKNFIRFCQAMRNHQPRQTST